MNPTDIEKYIESQMMRTQSLVEKKIKELAIDAKQQKIPIQNLVTMLIRETIRILAICADPIDDMSPQKMVEIEKYAHNLVKACVESVILEYSAPSDETKQ